LLGDFVKRCAAELRGPFGSVLFGWCDFNADTLTEHFDEALGVRGLFFHPPLAGEANHAFANPHFNKSISPLQTTSHTPTMNPLASSAFLIATAQRLAAAVNVCTIFI
jgi:hypothetical protein